MSTTRGFTSFSIPATLARYARTEHPIFWIVPTDAHAARFTEDLQALGARSVLSLPTWSISPFRETSLSLRTRFDRVGVLRKIESSQHVVTSILGALQVVPNRDAWNLATLELRTGAPLPQGSREEFLVSLRHLGYERVDRVEDPGTFSVRGEVIDLKIPGDESPVRIELFDTDIERMRSFDPESQRSFVDTIKVLSIPPAREIWLRSSERRRVLKERLKLEADHRSIHRAVRDPMIDLIESGFFPDVADAWVPYLEPSDLSSWLPEHTEVIWYQPLLCKTSAQKTLSEFQDQFDRNQSRRLVPEPKELFPSLPAWFEKFPNVRNWEAAVENEPQVDESIPPENLQDLPRFAAERARAGDRLCFFSEGDVDRTRFIQWCEREKIAAFETRNAPLSESFIDRTSKTLFLTDREFFGRKSKAAPTAPPKDWASIESISSLQAGDLVVHFEHGIGKFVGLQEILRDGVPEDFILLEYADGAKLYLPVYKLNILQRYSSSVAGSQVLARLGTSQFAKAKENAFQSARKLAFDLVKLHARRAVARGPRISDRGEEYREFVERFPFPDTPDQFRAIEDCFRDFEAGKLLDRVVCGDVGFGKTEVAMRVSFQVALSGKQVIVLVPTTLLALQHETQFKARFSDTALRVESISRLKSTKRQTELIAEFAEGKIDILIGTHRVLSKDFKFKDLGLLVIDEEHRFGVEHKESIRNLQSSVHTLLLTATPIPRTLHTALAGIRDISLIRTPPIDRVPIRTMLGTLEREIVQPAIESELSRNGQIFFLHNEIHSLPKIAGMLQEWVPGLRIVVAHGQMAEGELEKVMNRFYRGEADLLLCTTIIESGLDVPKANTLFINRADAFGLSQLYQIRGRVGRSDRRAFAYFLVPSTQTLTQDAFRRLDALQRFTELGSGFQIAHFDLEIRGGGNLLGPEQSGHIAEVGLEMYLELVQEAIRDLSEQSQSELPRERKSTALDPEIRLPFESRIDEHSLPDPSERLAWYRRIARAENEEDIRSLEQELRDLIGPLPVRIQNLFWLLRVKILARESGIRSLLLRPEGVTLDFDPESSQHRIDPDKILTLAGEKPYSLKLTGSSRLFLRLPAKDAGTFALSFEDFLSRVRLNSAPPHDNL